MSAPGGGASGAGTGASGAGTSGEPSAPGPAPSTEPSVVEFFEELRTIPWVPVVVTRPERWCVVPWPARPWPRFMAPAGVGVEDNLWAISSTRGIVDGTVDSPQLRQHLGWAKPLDAMSLTSQILALADLHAYKCVAWRSRRGHFAAFASAP